jgi:hypothetical protein
MGALLSKRLPFDAVSISLVKRPHLSCIDDPAHEFQAPDGSWLLIFRAIVYDGWLLWKDALPEEPILRGRLDRSSYDGIESLARRIHVVHQLMPNYRSLTKSPFTVKRWWDPDDEDPLWRGGRACLLKLDGYSSKEFARAIPVKCKLTARCVTDQWIEFNVADPDVDAVTTKTAASGKNHRAASQAEGRPSPPQ